jgi:hypothetical protein
MRYILLMSTEISFLFVVTDIGTVKSALVNPCNQ